MSHDRVAESQCMCDEVEIGYLKKCVDGDRLVARPGGPLAHGAQGRQDRGLGLEEETVSSLRRPVRKLVGARGYLVANLNTEPARLFAISQSQNAGQKSRP